ncbi:MAG: hypothetical protein ACAH59_05560 [Pseudobdellovibrionaceae bacterium]
MKQFRLFALIQLTILTIGSLVLAEAKDPKSAASFAVGCLFVLVNVLLTAFLWSRIIQKKLVALSVTIIVFKYAILGLIIYQLLTVAWVNALWLCAGFGSLMVSALFYSLIGPSGDDEIEDTNNE